VESYAVFQRLLIEKLAEKLSMTASSSMNGWINSPTNRTLRLRGRIMDQKKRADISANPSHDTTRHTKKRKPLKLERTLELMLRKPKANAYDANDMYGDLHLNTSVSDLQLRYGFRILRECKKVRGRASDRPAAHYWFLEDERQKALDLLNAKRVRRGVALLTWSDFS
jgi:hypothetical protein